MTLALHIVQWLLGVCTAFSCLYYLLCADSVRRWRARQLSIDNSPAVSILKPIRGADPEQAANFESFLCQDYPAYQVVFGALEADDPALAVARECAAARPNVDVDIVAGGETFGLNRKVSNLESLRSRAKHDILILSDTDMRVGPDYLARVVAPFSDPHVGLVTCPYRGFNAKGPAAILEALGIGADFAPSVILTDRLFGMSFAFGSTIAIRTSVLEEIGGFRALADELADDYRLGNRTAAAGYRVVLSDYVVDDVLSRESFGEMWSRRLRWSRTMRAVQPLPYFASFVTHGTALSCLFAAATGGEPLGFAVLGGTLVVRCATACYSAATLRDTNLPRRLAWLPLSDLVSFALWAGAFLGSSIEWRGERFRVQRGGKLAPRA